MKSLYRFPLGEQEKIKTLAQRNQVKIRAEDSNIFLCDFIILFLDVLRTFETFKLKVANLQQGCTVATIHGTAKEILLDLSPGNVMQRRSIKGALSFENVVGDNLSLMSPSSAHRLKPWSVESTDVKDSILRTVSLGPNEHHKIFNYFRRKFDLT